MQIKTLIEAIQEYCKKYPSCLLLAFVYIFIIPRSLSYDQAWVQPEQFYIKMGIVSTGEHLNLLDIKQGLDWKLFEYQPRLTRPFSSYFEIVDTKFRIWLWHYILPHPSLSLTWIFSLILAPLFLYRLLRNYSIGTQVAMAMVAFYLVTPGVLSYEVMLFRPAKPMANFFIIYCLYLASRLKKNFVDQRVSIPSGEFSYFWIVTALSFYWDETALLIFPAVILFFPQVIRRKYYLFLWASLPLITCLCYFKILPYLSLLAGYGFPQLAKYNLFSDIVQTHNFYQSLVFLAINTKNLILETMGIIIPDFFRAPGHIAVCFYLALIGWGVTMYYVFKVKQKWDLRSFFMAGLALFFNYLISVTMRIWGPYYYGSFWSVFFVIYLACLLEKAQIPKRIFVICFFFILINMSNVFLETNKIYKKYHYYPYNPWIITSYFWYDRTRFDPSHTEFLNGGELKSLIYEYWSNERRGKSIDPLPFPRELCWLPVELEPTKKHFWHELLIPDNKNFLEGK